MSRIIPHILPIIFAIIFGSIISVVAIFAYKQYEEVDLLKELTKPVVKDMTITNIIDADDGVLIKVEGYIVRECGPPLTVYGNYGIAHEYRFVEILFLDDKEVDGKFKKPDSNKIENNDDLVDFGWWKLKPSPYNDTPFSLYSIHNCNGINVTSLIGVFDTKELKKENK